MALKNFIWGLILGMAFTWQCLLAQDPGYIQYTIRNGLASMNIYALGFDSQGVMWLGTEHGLTAYDGQKFKIWDEAQGLPGREVLDLVVDGRGLWLKIYGEGVGYWENQTWRAVDAKTIDWPMDKLWPYMGNRGHVNLLGHWSSIYVDMQQPDPEVHRGIQLSWCDQAERTHAFGTCQHRVEGRCVWEGRIIIDNYTVHDGVLYVVNPEGVWKVEGGEPELLYPLQREGIVCQELMVGDDGLLLGYSDGLIVVEQEEGAWQGRHLFREFNIQAIGRDHEGSYWLGTHQNGLLQVADLSLLHYSFPGRSSVFEVEHGADGKVYVAGTSHQLGVVEDGGMKTGKFPGLGRGKAMDLVAGEAGEIWVVFDHLAVENGRRTNGWKPYGALKAIAPGPGDSLLLSDRISGLFLASRRQIFDGNSYNRNSNSGKLDLRHEPGMRYLGDWAWDLHLQPGSKRVWGIGAAGVFHFEDGKRTELGKADAEIMQIHGAAGGKPLFCTPRNGLFYAEGDEVRAWPLNFGPEPPYLQNVFAASPRETWLAARDGIYYVAGAPGDTAATIAHLGPNSGFPFHIVYDISVDDSAVWAATDQGLYQFPKNLPQRPTVRPLLIIDSLVAGATALAAGAEVPYDAVLKLCFRGISYLGGPEFRYEYQLLGRDRNWHSTSEEALYLAGLAPGPYTMRLRAVHGTDAISQIHSISWTVRTPFWMEMWVKVLVFLMAVLGLIGLVLVTNAIRKSYEDRRLHLVDLERKALRAQMNPHFLYNALNALHVYIGNHEERKAHLFLSKFARLTRMVLTASEESSVTLASELEAARYFLELERMRHGEGFDFEIECEVPYSTEKLAVPSLLIQPFLENAVLHGVRPLTDRRGKIQVRVTGEENLVITIQDNGVGRTAAARSNAHKAKDHQSHGSRITLERIRLTKGASCTIRDLTDARGQPAGTECEIILPWKPTN